MTGKSQPDQYSEDNRNIGKIYKGTLNDAPMKVRVASIPSKFQKIIYRNNSNPAFGNSRQRFYSQSQNQKKYQPGPGQYVNFNKTQDKIFSKKGYGAMISNTKLQRLHRNYTGLPGPGSYNPNTQLVSRMKKSSSLALLSSKIQGHQLFKNQLQHAKKIPGPGIYEAKTIRANSQTHAFSNDAQRFSTKRLNSIYINDEETPGVGYYHYEFTSMNTAKITSSKQVGEPKITYKKGITQMNQLNQRQKLKIVRQILTNKNRLKQKNQPNQIGPGSYNANKNVFDKKVGFKIHETSYDRFGQSIKRSPNKQKDNLTARIPNLDQIDQSNAQNVKIFRDDVSQSDNTLNKLPHNSPIKKYDYIQQTSTHNKISKALTSMFKSNIARYNFIQKNINDPCKYSPTKLDKKSHLINFQNKWV